MKCPKCGSENVNVQIITDTQIKEKKHGIGWWLFVGWWWLPLKWLVFTVPALIVKIFAPKKYDVKTTQKKIAVCQDCGNSWKA